MKLLDKIRRIDLRRVEGEEEVGVTEETEPTLKPEERSGAEVFWTFVKYPFWISVISFLVSFLILVISRGILKGIIGALALALIIGVAASYAIVIWAVKIPADPPHAGSLTVGGRKTATVIPEGWFLRIPFFRDVIPVNITRVDQDFAPQDVFTQDNVEIEMTSHLSWQPDPRRLPMFLKAGREKGVRGTLDNMVPQYTRTWAKTIPLDNALAAQEDLIASILEKLVGKRPEDIRAFEKDGKSDVAGLGIMIFRYNIGNMKPVGEVAKAMQERVKEDFERRAEVFETGTEINQTVTILLAGQGKNMEKMKPEEIEKALKKIDKEEFMRILTWVKEFKTVREAPGSVIPGLRERLIKGEAIPFDTALAAFTGLLKKAAEAKVTKNKTETESTGGEK